MLLVIGMQVGTEIANTRDRGYTEEMLYKR